MPDKDLEVGSSNVFAAEVDSLIIETHRKKPLSNKKNLFSIASESDKKHRIRDLFSSIDSLIADNKIFTAEGLKLAIKKIDEIRVLLTDKSAS